MRRIRYILEKIHECLLNIFIAKSDEYYSYDEPPLEKMENKLFWIQIVRKGSGGNEC